VFGYVDTEGLRQLDAIAEAEQVDRTDVIRKLIRDEAKRRKL